MSGITVTKKNGNLVITAPIDSNLPESSSGKTNIVCSTHGNINTGIEVKDKVVFLGLNAYTFKAGKKAKATAKNG